MTSRWMVVSGELEPEATFKVLGTLSLQEWASGTEPEGMCGRKG